MVEQTAEEEPILSGVGEIFALTDVYEVHPSPGAKILLRGCVLGTLEPGAEPAKHMKVRRFDGDRQLVNSPMMPVAWTRLAGNPAGGTNRVFCTTMGSAEDLQDENLRRLVVNAIYWGLDLPVPRCAEVDYVQPYAPSPSGTGRHRVAGLPTALAPESR